MENYCPHLNLKMPNFDTMNCVIAMFVDCNFFADISFCTQAIFEYMRAITPTICNGCFNKLVFYVLAFFSAQYFDNICG